MAQIEFKRMYSMQNGNKVTKKNWHKVVAKGTRPCKSVHGVPAIEEAKRTHGAYYETWKLVYETDEDPERSGFIFREINHGMGINGRHKTPKLAIWHAMSSDIKVYLED